MKHLLLSAALLSLSLTAQAQSSNPAIWCPTGATWTYGFALFSAQGTMKVSYARDTVVAGQPAQLLVRSLTVRDLAFPSSGYTTYRMPSVITRVVGDRVEVQANGQFYTLYDFAAQPGSSWLTPRVVPSGPCPTEVVRVNVDSLGQQRVGGRTLRWFRAHLTTPTGGTVLGQWAGRIYEQVGHLGYMQPQSPTCGGTDPGYLGNLVGYQVPGQPSLGLVYVGSNGVLLAATATRAAAAGFRAYPNPSAGRLTLELPAAIAPAATLRLLDLAGRTVLRAAVPATRQLDVSILPAGTYVLLLENSGQPVLSQRLLVE